MPRSSKDKYTMAYDVLTSLASRLGIANKPVSDIFIREINRNRIRMRGTLLPYHGTIKERRQSQKVNPITWLAGYDVEHKSTTEVDFIPQDLFTSGFQIIPAYLLENPVLLRPALCDRFSNIYIGPVKGAKATKVIAGAQLLNSDRDKILVEAFEIKSPPALAGAKPSAKIWGEVILHLLELQGRNALSSIRTTKALVDSVTNAHPTINPTTIQHVLDYVVKSQNENRNIPLNSGSLKPSSD